jgi:DMSO/TMAO reductase YedYZ molybdopterin-dependent catalytic subunit
VKRKEVPAGRLPPGQRPAKGWPVLHYGPVPPGDLSAWDFRIWGEVENPTTLSYGELRSLPAVRVTADFHCVTKFSVLDNEWEGVSFKTVAELVRPTSAARFVMAHCEYGYEANLPLEALLADDVLFAWGHNGDVLTPEHGYPLRLVVPQRYAWKSAKWVRGLEFMAEDRLGFWEQRGYHNLADPWREERYTHDLQARGSRTRWRRQR